MKLLSTKLLISIITGVAAVATAVVIVVAKPSEVYRTIQVLTTEGTVTIERSGKNISAYDGMMLKNEDRITTAEDSIVFFILDSDKYICLYEESSLYLRVSGSPDKGKTSLKLEVGELSGELEKKLTEEETFDVQAANSVMAVRGTIFHTKTHTDETGKQTSTYTLKEGKVDIGIVSQDEDGEVHYETVSLSESGESVYIESNADEMTEKMQQAMDNYAEDTKSEEQEDVSEGKEGKFDVGNSQVEKTPASEEDMEKMNSFEEKKEDIKETMDADSSSDVPSTTAVAEVSTTAPVTDSTTIPSTTTKPTAITTAPATTEETSTTVAVSETTAVPETVSLAAIEESSTVASNREETSATASTTTEKISSTTTATATSTTTAKATSTTTAKATSTTTTAPTTTAPAPVTGLSVSNLPDGFTGDTVEYSIGSGANPLDFENVVVSAVTKNGSTVLKSSEYTIDTSAINYHTLGTYNVKFTYKADTSISKTIKVKMVKMSAETEANSAKGIAVDFADSLLAENGCALTSASTHPDVSKMKPFIYFEAPTTDANTGKKTYTKYRYLEDDEYSINISYKYYRTNTTSTTSNISDIDFSVPGRFTFKLTYSPTGFSSVKKQYSFAFFSYDSFPATVLGITDSNNNNTSFHIHTALNLVQENGGTCVKCSATLQEEDANATITVDEVSPYNDGFISISFKRPLDISAYSLTIPNGYNLYGGYPNTEVPSDASVADTVKGLDFDANGAKTFYLVREGLLPANCTYSHIRNGVFAPGDVFILMIDFSGSI